MDQQSPGINVMDTSGASETPAVPAGAPSSAAADRLGFPRPVVLPPPLRGVVDDLRERAAQVVTLQDLARYDTGHAPAALARALRSRGWLYPLRTRGAWSVPFVGPGPYVGHFQELRARLTVRPDTPACLAGLYAAQKRGYLARPTEAHIGYPPGLTVPRSLDGFPVLRWQPQIPLDEVGGLPVWKDETLLAFMAAKPAQMLWEDVADWLPEVCWGLEAELLIAELAGRPRAVWMKTAFLASRAKGEAVADALLDAAPAGAGPYVFGHRDRRLKQFIYPPEWVPRFQIMDYVLASWWLPKWR